METVEQVVTDAGREAEEERLGRQREVKEEQDRQEEEEERDDVGAGAILAPGMNTETVEQAPDEQARLWDDVGRRAERRGRIRRLFRRMILAGGLISIGAVGALFLTQTPLEDIVDSVRDFWRRV